MFIFNVFVICKKRFFSPYSDKVYTVTIDCGDDTLVGGNKKQ